MAYATSDRVAQEKAESVRWLICIGLLGLAAAGVLGALIAAMNGARGECEIYRDAQAFADKNNCTGTAVACTQSVPFNDSMCSEGLQRELQDLIKRERGDNTRLMTTGAVTGSMTIASLVLLCIIGLYRKEIFAFFSSFCGSRPRPDELRPLLHQRRDGDEIAEPAAQAGLAFAMRPAEEAGAPPATDPEAAHGAERSSQEPGF